MIRKVRIEEAVGMALGHDVARVAPGETGVLPFRRGYVVREEDIPQLLDIGKEHIYVVESEESEVHENEAARRIARATIGEGLECDGPGGGAARIKAKYTGVLPMIFAGVRPDASDIAKMGHGGFCLEKYTF